MRQPFSECEGIERGLHSEDRVVGTGGSILGPWRDDLIPPRRSGKHWPSSKHGGSIQDDRLLAGEGGLIEPFVPEASASSGSISVFRPGIQKASKSMRHPTSYVPKFKDVTTAVCSVPRTAVT
jgi:hypothetical protein